MGINASRKELVAHALACCGELQLAGPGLWAKVRGRTVSGKPIWGG